MSGCFGCYFYEGGFMWNRCNYFEMEYFGIKDKCIAFSTDGNISEESEAKIFYETNGMFGKPKRAEREEE